MRAMTSGRFVAIIVWMLVVLTVAPPAVLAEGMSGAGNASAPVPFGLAAGGAMQMLPGQPIVTNPHAVERIEISQTPCPGQPGSSATAPSLTQDTERLNAERMIAQGFLPPSVTQQRGNAAPATGSGQPGMIGGQSPTTTGQPAAGPAPPAGAGQGGAGSGAGQMGASGTAGGVNVGGNVVLPKHGGLLSPLIQSQQDQSQGSVDMAKLGQGQIEPVGTLSIEEAFSQFFLLQGMTNQLKQFGYNYFDLSFSGFPQVMDMPVGPDYVLGPDDTLAIHIWNVPDPSFNRTFITSIERDGTIFLPTVGTIPVTGATFGQVHQIIHAKLSTVLKKFDFHISMGRLRSIKVFVVGEVVRPGSYELSSLATSSHALYAACGPAKSGSLRHIQVIRGNKIIADLDYYEFFIRGNRSQDIQLHSGDTVLVKPIGSVVAIGGPVRRPAIYELKERTTLPELIELAGGLAPSADRRRCQVFRIEAGKKRVILDVGMDGFLNKEATSASGADAPVVTDGDFVRIASVPLQIENAVTLTGAVRAPGAYELKPGMRLLDVVKPEQLLLDSYLDKAELVRTDPLTYETSVKPFSIKALLQGQEDNVELRRLDKVVVGSQLRVPSVVSISGEIKRPGSYTLETGERLSSVLKRAGGATPRSYLPGLILIRQSVSQRQQSETEKFLAIQRQRLTAEAAALTAGAAPTPGAAGAAQLNTDVQAIQLQMQALDQLVNRVQVGRVILNIRSFETLEDTEDDIVLEASDQITIPPEPRTVTIIGAVRNSTNVIYRAELRLEDYIRAAGGMIEEANDGALYIVRANGSTEAGYAKLKTINAGDTIIVPEKIEPKTKPLTLWTAVAQIFSQLGILAAALVVIGR